MIIRCNNCFREYEEALGLCPYCGFVPGEPSEDLYCLTPGTSLAERYIIGQKIGMGGFGIIYKAWDRRLETTMAIKEFYPSGLVNRLPNSADIFVASQKRENEFIQGKTRFMEEARYLAKFNSHPNIVNVFEYFEANGTAYFVMEYLEGKTLEEILKERDNQPLPYDQCITIAVAICSALHSIHMAGILHRDVSPSNIMLCNNGEIKLLDFGAAQFPSGIKVQLRIVKPGFAPPEQYDEVNKQGPFTDIYALGATLYYALSGQVPVESSDRKETDPLVPLETLNPTIPHHMCTTVMRSMAVDPQYRFQDIDQFEQGFLNKTFIRSEKEERKKRRLKKRMGIALSFAVVLCIGTFSAIAYRNAALSSLPPADLSLWYKDRAPNEEEMNLAFGEIIEHFTEGYPDISVQFEAKGLDALSEPSEDVNIVETSDFLGVTEEDGYIDVSDLINELGDEYYIQESLLTDYQFPIGLIVPVIYVNTGIGNISSTATLAQMQEECTALGGKMEASEQGLSMYRALYGDDASSYGIENAKNNFKERSSFVYLGTSCDYEEIQESMPGEYAVLFPECGSCVYEYGVTWSVLESTDAEERAALGFLEYLTSDLAQDYFCVQNQNPYLPISKSELDVYVSVYGELEGVLDYLDLPFVDTTSEENG